MSHITRKQMQHLMRNPTAYMEHRASGALPRTIRPASPLITLLESIPPCLRSQIRGVRIDPGLGYQCRFQFHTAEQLLRWVKPASEMLECESWPAEAYRLKRFNHRLKLEDLQAYSASWPGEEIWQRFGINPMG